MAARGRGLISLYIYIEKCKNPHIILQKCSFGNLLPRLFEPFRLVKKTWPPAGGAYFPYISILKNVKILLSETTEPISLQFCRNVPLVILYQECSSHLDLSKNMATRGQGLFSLYIYTENFKNLLVRNHWTDFNIILQKCSFGDSLPRLFKPFGFVKKYGRQGAGLIFPIYRKM